ncbi:MAG TPA: hypothetical protein VIO95_10080, partial [Mycobacterium sp.]
MEEADPDDDVVVAFSDLLPQPLTVAPITTVAAATPATTITGVFIDALLSVGELPDCSANP